MKRKPLKKLKMAIFASGWNQEDVARKCGLTPSILSQMINAKISYKELNFDKIAKLLNCEVEEIKEDK